MKITKRLSGVNNCVVSGEDFNSTIAVHKDFEKWSQLLGVHHLKYILLLQHLGEDIRRCQISPSPGELSRIWQLEARESHFQSVREIWNSRTSDSW